MAQTGQTEPGSQAARRWQHTRRIDGQVWRLSITWEGDLALCSWRRGKDPVQGFALRTTANRRDVIRHFQRLVLGTARS